MSEEGAPWQQFYRLARRRLYRIHRDDTVFAGGDESFGVGEDGAGDLAYVEVLKETGGLNCQSMQQHAFRTEKEFKM